MLQGDLISELFEEMFIPRCASTEKYINIYKLVETFRGKTSMCHTPKASRINPSKIKYWVIKFLKTSKIVQESVREIFKCVSGGNKIKSNYSLGKANKLRNN